MTSQAEDRARRARPEANRRATNLGQKLLAGGGVLGALAASSCCLVPLLLFAIGIGGAWIGYLTRLAPYQPYFLAVAAGCVGFGYWLRHRSKKIACSDGEICARPLPNRTVAIGFVFAIILIVAALALDFARSAVPVAVSREGENRMTRLLAAALVGISLIASSTVYAGEKTVMLAVPSMYCAACPITVKSSLEAVPGVVKVVVSLADKTAVVTFDDAKTAPPALMTATTNAGYPSAIKG